ncbi:MAG: LegC family aminotransferase [Deltaproteobacteria bacterium]|nr:LegC family aminotransferase [Deltaproteobacteria bacterium]
MIPLSVPHLKGNELKYAAECVETEWVSSAGKFVARFEEEICRYTGAAYAVACINGTAALHISLLLSDVQRGDEVLVPTVTFIAPINAVKYVGAEPVFMDCDDHLNIDPEKVASFLDQECRFDGTGLYNKKTGARVKAIIPVHVFGHPVSLAPLVELARKYNLKLIEDATESLGSFYTTGIHAGKRTGTIGDFGCYSFNGNKIITTGGGGMIVTDDKNLAARARYLTTQAKDDEELFVHHEIGYNYRLTNIQAALGCAQLETLEKFVEIKRQNFRAYQEALKGVPGLTLLTEPSCSRSNYWYYTLIVDSEKFGQTNLELRRKLKEEKIESKPIWALNHRQKPYKENLAYQISNAERLYRRCLSLPCSIGLTAQEIAKVTQTIRSAYASR